MSQESSHLNDREFVLSTLEDYYGEVLSRGDNERFNRLLHDEQVKDLVETTKAAIGKFQLSFQAYYLSEDQRVRLHDIVEASDLRRTREVQRIEQVGRWEALGDFRRRLSIIILVAALIFGVVYFFTPEPSIPFHPLESLSYEAAAMEEEAFKVEALAQLLEAERRRQEAEQAAFIREIKARGGDAAAEVALNEAALEFDDAVAENNNSRLDLPSDNLDEISAFINTNKTLDFRPNVLDNLPPGWDPEGASVIDYDKVKVIAIQFASKNFKYDYGDYKVKERMLYFNFKGEVNMLPQTSPQDINGFKYYSYTTGDQNIVVWQVYGDVVGMLVGHRTIETLARIAMGGST